VTVFGLDLTINSTNAIIKYNINLEFDMDFFAYLGIFFAVWIMIKIILSHVGNRVQHEELKQLLAEKIRIVRLEKHEQLSDLLYAYDEENNQFLGQGATQEEIKQRITDRFPDRIFLLEGQPFSKKALNLPQ
jgi:F0F1-type ATP synthase alpha subunit